MTPLARTILFSVAIYVSAFAFFLLSQADFVLTDFAILDDLSYFHAYLVGEAVAVPTNFLPYVLLDMAAKLNSVSAIKIVSLGSLATITTLFALCLRTITARPLFSAICAFPFTTFPVALDQGFFVTGSHPTLGAVFALSALVLFLESKIDLNELKPIRLAGVAFLALLASFCSPTTIIFVLAPPIWVLLSCTLRRSFQFIVPAALLTTWPLLVRAFAGDNSFHYAETDGWTDASIANIFRNIGSAFEVAIIDPIFRTLPTTILYLILVAALIVVLLVLKIKRTNGTEITTDSNTESPRIVATASYCLISGALVLGPSLIVTAYLTRYAWPAFLFGALIVAIVISFSIPKQRHASLIAIIVFSMLTGLNFWSGRDARSTEYGKYLIAHRLVSDIANTYSETWKPQSQIVVIFPNQIWSPSLGTNHWSTAYIRLLADRDDLLGLVGWSSQLSNRPFIQEWQPQGPDFWQTENGKRTRSRMRGLEIDRPTYVYVYDADSDGLMPSAVTFITETGEAPFLTAGDAPRSAQEVSFTDCTESLPWVPWPINQDIGAVIPDPWSIYPDWPLIERKKFSFDGSSTDILQTNFLSNEMVHLSITLEPKILSIPNAPYSRTHPPMPLTSKFFSGYQIGPGFHFTSPELESIVVDDSDRVDVDIFGVEGCRYFARAKEGVWRVLRTQSLNSDWTLGKGIQERNWEGSMSWRLAKRSHTD